MFTTSPGWDGTTWEPLAGGIDEPNATPHVADMLVFDDGSGEALFVCGRFDTADGMPGTKSIAKWDGTAWASLGNPEWDAIYVEAICAFDDGDGPALFCGGRINEINNIEMKNVAKWDGTSWTPLGPGVNRIIHDFAVFDDGTGPALYACGEFTEAGGSPAFYIARWDGATWSAVGGGLDDIAYALAVVRENGRNTLWVGGWFEHAGGVPARRLARWDGNVWSPIDLGCDGDVLAIEPMIDPSTGEYSVWVSGEFTFAGTESAHQIARYSPAKIDMPILDLTMRFGSLLEGGMTELEESDDTYLLTRSQFGFSVQHANIVEFIVGFDGSALPTGPNAMLDIEIESRMNQPGGTGIIKVRNWDSGVLEEVHSYTVSQADAVEAVFGLDGTDRVRNSDSRVELGVLHSAVATFTPLGFEARFDLLRVSAR